MKQAIILRCRTFGNRERQCYDFLKSYFGNEVFVITNTIGNENIKLADIQNFNWRHKDLVAKGWPRIDLGWRCGDINYYEFIQRNSGYDFVWMCEPDVLFHQIGASQFFKKYEREKADFLAVNVEKKEKNWHWYRHSSIISPKVYGCFFCLTRFSSAAIRFLREERRRLIKYMSNEKIPAKWFPNDEGFVSTLLLNSSKFLVKSINEEDPDLFELFDTHPQSAFFPEKIKLIKQPRVIHRVLNVDEFIGKQAQIMVPDDFIENRRHILRTIKNKVKDEAIVKKITKASQVRLGILEMKEKGE